MKILAPITSASDIEVLNPTIYNTEFFCGYTTDYWERKHSSSFASNSTISVPLNNRNGKNANISSISDLKIAVELAEKYNTTLFLVLNAKHYPKYSYTELSKYLDEVSDIGIKKMIVCDIGMISYLNDNYPDIKVSVSCLNQVTNKMAVHFYANFQNVERIVFPRHMSSSEIISIASSFPNIQFEYFIFSNRCLYDDGYCRGIHEFTPICKASFYSENYSRNGLFLNDQDIQSFRSSEFEFKDWTRNEIMVNEKKYCTASFACTACSLIKTYQIPNIVSLKISIRGHDINERLRQVQIAHNVIRCVEQQMPLNKIQETVSHLYGKDTLCSIGMSCMMK